MSSVLKAPSQLTPQVNGLQIPASNMGQAIPLIYGHCRVGHQLIFWNNFQVNQASAGGKGKGGKGGSQTTYSVNADMLLGYGPLEGLGSLWYNQIWFYVNYGFQIFNVSGTGSTFSLAISNNPAPVLMISGVALQVSYNNNYNDYVFPGVTRSFALAGTSFLPLYNGTFPAPNLGQWANNTNLPYALYNATYGTNGVIVNFPSSVTNPVILVYYIYQGGSDQPAQQNQGGKKSGGGTFPIQNPGLVFEPTLGSGPSGQPILYQEFSGVGGANIPLGASPELPAFNYEVQGLYALGNAKPISTFNPSAVIGDVNQYLHTTSSGDCNPADIIADIICSGNLYEGWGGQAGAGGQRIAPTTFSGGYNNPTFAYDDNPTSAATATTVFNIFGGSIQEDWYGFSAAPVTGSVYLSVTSAAETPGGYASAGVSYSLDNGATFTDIYFIGGQSAYGQQTNTILLPSGVDTTKIIVRAKISSQANNAAFQWIYEIWLSYYAPGGSGGSALILSSGVLWNHGLGFSNFSGAAHAQFSPYYYSRYGGILIDEPNLYPGGGSNPGLMAVRNYCHAYGIYLSGGFDSQQSAGQLLDDLCKVANCAPVFDGTGLDFIPYCEASNYDNGTSYVAPTAAGPAFAFTDYHLMPTEGKQPVVLDYDRAPTNFNSIQIGFKDALGQFNDDFVIVSDSLDITQQGSATSTQETYNYINDRIVAQKVGYTRLRRNLLQSRKPFSFTLPYCWAPILRPMTLITLSDPAMSSSPIPMRITSIKIGRAQQDSAGGKATRIVTCTAELYAYGGSSPVVPPSIGVDSPAPIQGGSNSGQPPGGISP